MKTAKFNMISYDGNGSQLWQIGKSFANVKIDEETGEILDINTDLEGWGGGREAGKRQIINLAFHLNANN